MCIIIAKNKGIEMPKMETIRTCFSHNPDGAGIMWAQNGVVEIKKGFMHWQQFEDFINALSESVDLKNTGVVIHCRITTHGGTKPQNCHPFPISKHIKDVKRTSLSTQVGVAHNGVISIRCIPGLSDTQTYIIKRLYKRYKADLAFFKSEYELNCIEKEISSKMAFLDNEGYVYTVGNFVNESGILFSNSSYKVHPYFDCNWIDYDAKILCPVEGYIIDDNGNFVESDGFDYFIDGSEKIYEYNYYTDILVPLPNAQAFGYSGIPYHFCYDNAFPWDEASIW